MSSLRVFALFGVVVFSALSPALRADDKPAVRRDDPASIRGAIYIPAGAFNAPQMWKNFNLDETKRDFGYARELHLNALRIWASYEYWQTNPDQFKNSFDEMLAAADADGLRILISLFENDGVPPTPENMWTTDPAKALDIMSPGPGIASAKHPELWDKPRSFLTWFMDNYRNDSRLLAIEVMNEPGPATMPFAESMFRTAKSEQGSVPLTIGFAQAKTANLFIPLGLDIIELHDNFPPSAQALGRHIQLTLDLARKSTLPVWLTEWQWVRPSGSGFNGQKITAAEKLPNYASLAATVRKYPIGSFFWSLMIKRAYLPSQRANGTVNGVFWPDGSVWSLADARAIANDPKLDLKENGTLPPGYLGYLKNAPSN